jgi:branched-subunit amino acid transport protein
MDNYWLVLIGMTCITFSCRYLFFAKSVPFKLGSKLQRILSFTAPSVLTAMWVPIVFLGHQTSSDSFITSPFLIAGIVTIFLSLNINKTLVVVVLGMGTFSVLNFFS